MSTDDAGPARGADLSRYWDVPKRFENACREVLQARDGEILTAPASAVLRVDTPAGIITVRLVSSEYGYQELRAPFANPRGVSFVIRPQTPPTLLERLTGGPWDLEVRHREFDEAFQVVTQTPMLTQEVLEGPDVVSAFLSAPPVEIRVRGGSQFAEYPKGLHELYVRSEPMVRAAEIEGLVCVVEALLARLDDLDSRSGPMHKHLGRLNGPGGFIHARGTAWEGDRRRRAAADALAEEGDARAVASLIGVLHDPDVILRAKAMRALGSIGDARAVPALVPLLGLRALGATRPLSEEAAGALRALGAGSVVDAFESALAGEPEALRSLDEHAEALSVALLDALDGPGRAVKGHIFNALAEMGAIHALPAMHAWVEAIQIPELAATCQAAIDALEALKTLPRPAASDRDLDRTLPRAAERRSGRHRRLPRRPPGDGS